MPFCDILNGDVTVDLRLEKTHSRISIRVSFSYKWAHATPRSAVIQLRNEGKTFRPRSSKLSAR